VVKTASLHRLFQLAVVVKGIDGVLELVGGTLLLVVGPSALHRLGVVLARHELADEPDDWVVMTLRRGGRLPSKPGISPAYLIGHGVLRSFSPTLLRGACGHSDRAVGAGNIVAYQLHRFVRTHSIVLLALMVVDLVVMVLIWRSTVPA
jgi:uncharacterized membrane protein